MTVSSVEYDRDGRLQVTLRTSDGRFVDARMSGDDLVLLSEDGGVTLERWARDHGLAAGADPASPTTASPSP